MRVFSLLLVYAAAAFAQPSNLTARFIAMGPGAAAQVDRGVLTFNYEVRPKQFAAAIMPAPPLAGMRRLRLRVKPDHDTALAVLLKETNTWQQVELAPGDFVLSDGANDPPDPDGKLDLDAVENIGVFDLAQFIQAMPENPEVPVTIERSTGRHSFSLDNFEVVAGGPAETPRAGIIDGFDRGFLQWMTLGGMELKLSATGNPLGAPAMEIDSTAPEGQIAIVTRRVSNLDLSRAAKLSFDVASQLEGTIVLSLEQKDGKRFNLTVYPPGAKEVFRVSVRLQDFEGPGQVNPAQLKSLAITDLTGQGNKMWVGAIRAE